MVINGKEVKIIQITPVLHTSGIIDVVIGLGDDGVVYISDPKNGFWEVYIDDLSEDEHEVAEVLS